MVTLVVCTLPAFPLRQRQHAARFRLLLLLRFSVLSDFNGCPSSFV
jgi:hypothetical protein